MIEYVNKDRARPIRLIMIKSIEDCIRKTGYNGLTELLSRLNREEIKYNKEIINNLNEIKAGKQDI